jgi:hypothetical protein
MLCGLPFSPLQLGQLRPSSNCFRPVSEANQITNHLTFIRCSFAHTFNFWNKLIRDHPMTYSSYSWPPLPSHTLVGIFWSFALISVRQLWPLVNVVYVHVFVLRKMHPNSLLQTSPSPSSRIQIFPKHLGNVIHAHYHHSVIKKFKILFIVYEGKSSCNKFWVRNLFWAKLDHAIPNFRTTPSLTFPTCILLQISKPTS